MPKSKSIGAMIKQSKAQVGTKKCTPMRRKFGFSIRAERNASHVTGGNVQMVFSMISRIMTICRPTSSIRFATGGAVTLEICTFIWFASFARIGKNPVQFCRCFTAKRGGGTRSISRRVLKGFRMVKKWFDALGGFIRLVLPNF